MKLRVLLKRGVLGAAAAALIAAGASLSPGLAKAMAAWAGPLSPTMPVTVRACPVNRSPDFTGLMAAAMAWVRFMQSDTIAGGISRHAARVSGARGSKSTAWR